MSDLRKAALTLHALADRDRAWLLERLPASHRQSLEYLLQELSNLGIPPDARLLEHAIAAARESAPLPSARATVDALTPDRMQTLLRGEPAGLVARVLAMQPWSWSEAFLRGLDASERRRLGEATRDGMAASAALDDWLLDDLARRSRESSMASDSTVLAAAGAAR